MGNVIGSILVGAAGIVIFLGGCSAGFDATNAQYRPADGNAVQSPHNLASAGDEVFSRQSGAMPLATVEFPANPNEQPRVQTVLDVLKPAPTTNPAALPLSPPGYQTGPGIFTGEATTLPADNPLMPTGAVPAVSTANAMGGGISAKASGQSISLSLFGGADGNVDLKVTNPASAGSVQIEKAGENWPGAIRVQLFSGAGAPMSKLQDFTASEITAAGQKVAIKATTDKTSGTATVTIPGFTRSDRIEIDWTQAGK